MSYPTNGSSRSPYRAALEFGPSEAFVHEGLFYLRLTEGAICLGRFPVEDEPKAAARTETELGSMLKCIPVTGRWSLAVLELEE